MNIEPINPVAFKLGTFPVHWYGIIIGIGIAVALFLVVRESERRGLHKDTFPDLLIWAIPIAIISARIYYVVFEWEHYSQHPEQIIQIWEGGIAIHGALIGSVLTTIIYAKRKGLSFWKLADIAAPSIIIGQAIGRWGNFINQEAHGDVVSRAFLENLHLPQFIVDQMYINGEYYHPTFLYESVWDLIGFIILMLLRKVNLRRGEMFLTYVIWYSIGRFFIEGLRTDSLMLTSGLRMAQVLSLVLIVGSIIILFYRRKKGLADERYLD
ncbi:prolipoprotein diacylglyceryl transferase [Lederbergia wuyishanensis]|uniref:Phosphatidylglycerol--prolipoprotein diacylglyceryl transferase n=1 Tax=Lederbergia wuyishanensis TaxID=1347903 RepID=A0ABU0D8H7_9BACI|nr:prolipoprotein diacylglyceryl transferase [Lederbergia wuyishanensis]MCJ8007684.1 prolipoprotein diacylglyceryl transferase [Lederbergia wuyishanensis]MDQ0344732.1 phosphatidylglycerol:prolipoprotein diacylglycerol transferase [Lederbergia wuyishanensis]